MDDAQKIKTLSDGTVGNSLSAGTAVVETKESKPADKAADKADFPDKAANKSDNPVIKNNRGDRVKSGDSGSGGSGNESSAKTARGAGPAKGPQSRVGDKPRTAVRGNDGDKSRRRRSPQSRGARQEGEDNEYIDQLLSINRVAKVVKGGRRFGFSALIVVGDGSGRVGCGSGQAREVSEAIRKATDKARNKMIRVPLREGRTLHHDVKGRHGAGKVILRAAPTGTGVIAGGPMRGVFEALGIKDVVAKSVGSSNPHNMVRATFDALQRTMSPRSIASKRGRSVRDVIKNRGKA